jgi:hypothetical protein
MTKITIPTIEILLSIPSDPRSLFPHHRSPNTHYSLLITHYLLLVTYPFPLFNFYFLHLPNFPHSPISR